VSDPITHRELYTLLILTAAVSVLLSVTAFTALKANFTGPQGEQGIQGESYTYEGKWLLTHDWCWAGDDLGEVYWEDTFTTDADFIMIQPYYVYIGKEPESAYTCVFIYEGQSATSIDDALYSWAGSGGYEGGSILVIGKGTYTIQIQASIETDVWIYIYEFLPEVKLKEALS